MSCQLNDPHAVAAEIHRYLCKRPQAMDTLEGIMRWWIPRIRLEEAQETVEQALALLERDGVIECIRIDAATVLYRGAPGD